METTRAGDPPGFGYRVVLRPTRRSAADFLERFRAVWQVVASWGRFSDEAAGEWPTTNDCLAALPKDFSQALRESHPADIDGWLDDIHDRDWVLWSARTKGDQVELELELDANSMPLSTWPLRLVAEVLGADVVAADLISVLSRSNG